METTSNITALFKHTTVANGKVEYLLSLDQDSRDGRSKAKFFVSIGFSLNNPTQFIETIQTHYLTARLDKTIDTKHGKKFVFVCILNTPFGKAVCIKSVWQIDHGKTVPRLISAYPN